MTASWLTQHVQFRVQLRASDLNRREQLYEHFIEEASRLYADAYEHNEAEAAKLVNLYALVSKMRVLSSPRIVESADRVVRAILETYLAPNKTFRDVTEILITMRWIPCASLAMRAAMNCGGMGLHSGTGPLHISNNRVYTRCRVCP